MSITAAPLVDITDIVRHVGPAAYERGRLYSRKGAVSDLTWDADTAQLSANVRGSDPLPYLSSVRLDLETPGRPKLRDSRCSCPLGEACKHISALVLTSNATLVQDLDLSVSGLDRVGGLLGGGVAGFIHTGSRSATAQTEWATGGDPAPQVPAWKKTVGALAEGAAASPSRGTPAATSPQAHSPLALQFELREQTPRTRDRWRGPTAKAATSLSTPGARFSLGVRPVTKSHVGNWVRTGITWSSVGYQSNRLGIDAEQERWFASFAALHRASRDNHAIYDPDWLYIDDFQSSMLWHLLEEASRLGIALVGSKKDVTVAIGAQATLSLDASTSDPSGGEPTDLRLDATLAIDGAPHPPQAAGAIGTHGVYTYEFAPHPRYIIAPTAAPLSAEQRRLLGRESTVIVPADDVPEFLSDYFPQLRRSIEVTSTDASVPLPQIVPPTLVLTVTFQPLQKLELTWGWKYGDSGTPKPLHVGRGTDPGRDAVFETEVVARVDAVLASAPIATLSATTASSTALEGLNAAEFADKTLPQFETMTDVNVVLVGDRPDYRELTEEPKLTIRTVETDQRDWFDLGVIVSVNGQDVPFAPLFTALSAGRKKLLLVDNSYLSLDQPAFDSLRELIEEASALDEWETGLRISRYQASLWADFEDLAEETEQAVSWRAAVAGLLQLASDAQDGVTPTPLPTSITAELRAYQVDGFNWLAFLHDHGLGGVLADDMGLGKTLQTIALMAHAVDTTPAETRKPFLVVAPTSVVPNWLTEITRFAPSLVAHGLTETQSKSGTPLADAVVGAHVVVTSYALFRLDFAAYQAHEWAGLILDEAQFVKNPASKAHECARDLAAPFKLAITGTPMENSLTDLWSLFAIVAPGLFPSNRKFQEDYVRPIGRGAGEDSHQAELLARLRRRIRPLMMRRTKEIVAKDLPAKQEQVLQIELSPRHKKLYDLYLQRERQKLLGLVEDLNKNRFIVFRSLTLLRMLSLDASLVDDQYSGIPSSKLDALFEQLQDVVAEGHRALIFSQFTSFLKKAAARLDREGIAYEYLDGSTLHRADVIGRFKKGDAPVFLISLKAGGFGLNLTEADYVFLLDPWWNPATESQAVDRTHRIGQTKNVMVYRLVAKDTIEEKVMALKEQKARLFDAVMDDDAVFSSALTADDIRALLE